MNWSVEFVNESVEAVLDGFPRDQRASFSRIAGLIREHGLEKVHEPYVKHLEGQLWEIRMKGKSGIARAVYVTAVGKRVVIVHVFTKKTEKTPRREIERRSNERGRFSNAQIHSGRGSLLSLAQRS